MNNYKLTIQYDGTNYAGWQIQKEERTVQAEISRAIEKILQEEINLIGSGRTDAGVHAFGQVANFRTSREFDIPKFQHSLNSLIPDDISINCIKHVDENFHARFDAVKRSYFYIISHQKTPFYFKYSYNFSPIAGYDINRLNELSSALKGEHDFTSFCRAKSEIENKSCIIQNIHWKQFNSFTYFYVEANRFLHGMVRTLVGTILETYKRELKEENLYNILEAKDRTAAGEAVPAKGLFLFKVRY